ncbi:MAG: hypothetical protein MI924_01590 [Chloroflexales bacterium]|nr:hypothetical protein [Chloroflexales bacterium]
MDLLTLAGWINLLAILFGIVTVIVNVGFAIHVALDASALDREKRLIFGPAALWVLTTLLFGVFAATIYWIVNRSTLRND